MEPRRVPFSMTFGAIERTLQTMFGATDATKSAMMARYKYLQKSDFPNRRVGRGNRVGYQVEDVFQILLAFELLEFAMPPGRVIRLVRTRWGETRRAIAMDWLVDRGKGGMRSFLVTTPRSLAEAAAAPPDQSDGPLLDGFEIWSAAALTEWAEATDGGRRRLAVIDPRAMTAAFVGSACSREGGAMDPIVLGGALDDWAEVAAR